MKFTRILPIIVFCVVLLSGSVSYAAPVGPAVREAAEIILKKFGRGVAGQSLEEVTAATTRMVARYGDDALPFLRKSGHAGFSALREAGDKAPDLIRLYARRGDEAIWLISDSRRLSLFLRHGDEAANAIIRHPGIAENLISRHGDRAVGALNKVSRQNAQRLHMMADDGVMSATSRSRELLETIAIYGDRAMEFVWKHKGPLAVTAVLATFLNNREAYISGAKELALGATGVVAENTLQTIADNVNGTLILSFILSICFLPLIVSRLKKAYTVIRSTHRKPSPSGETS